MLSRYLWKRIAWIFLAFIAISILAVYVAVSRYDFNRLKPLIEKTVLDSTGRELTLRGDVRVRFGLSPSLVVEDVRFQNPSSFLGGMRPDMARIKSLKVHVSLIPIIFGNVRVKRLVIVEPDISIETDRSGRSNLEFEKPKGTPAPKPSGETGSSRFSLDHITIEKGLLTYRDGRSGKSYAINLERLDARTSDVYRALKVKGTYNDMPFEISGRLSSPLPATYRISDFKASLENSNLSGTAEITTGKRPGLKADFRSDKIDLRSFRRTSKKKITAEDKKRVFTDESLPVNILEKVDAEVKFAAGKILLPGISLNDFTAEMTLKDAHLFLNRVRGEAGGASLSGSADIDAHQRTFAAVFSAHGIDTDRMLKELDAGNTLQGKLDVDINVKGRGGSVAEMMAGLNGNLSVVMGKGSIDNKYLGLIGKGLREGIMRLVNPSSQASDRTGVNCFVCRIKTEKGLSNIEALVLDTDLMSVIGSGHIDLKTERLNVSLKPSPKKTFSAGRFSISLNELAKPFRLGGTLANPSLAMDPTQTAITVGKAIGGVALFGPAGIAAVLAGQKNGMENPCLSAIESATTKKTPEKKKDDLPKGIGDIEKGIRKLLGR